MFESSRSAWTRTAGAEDGAARSSNPFTTAARFGAAASFPSGVHHRGQRFARRLCNARIDGRGQLTQFRNRGRRRATRATPRGESSVGVRAL